MSDNFEMVVDAEVSIEDAKAVSQAVLDRFWDMNLIVAEASEDCVLGGRGYKPGPLIPSVYDLQPREGAFWELLTNGVEPQVGRGFNFWALGPVFEGLTCPECLITIKRPDDSFMNAIGEALSEWNKQAGEGIVKCPQCGARHSITEWICTPSLGFGNLSFTFWNWPPLSASSWRIDLIGIIRETTGHRLTHTYGHI